MLLFIVKSTLKVLKCSKLKCYGQNTDFRTEFVSYNNQP